MVAQQSDVVVYAPGLSVGLVERVLARYPVSIADAVAGLVAADGLHERRDRVVECFRASVRTAAALLLAARHQLGPPPGGDGHARRHLGGLRRGHITDGQWMALARALARPWRSGRDGRHPLPELIELFGGGERAFVRACDGLLEMRRAETVAHGSTGDDADIAALLARRVPQLEIVLDAQAALWDRLRLVVPSARGRARVLAGDTPVRGRWRRADTGAGLPADEPVLVDAGGRAHLALAPFVRVAAPSPGAPEELFVFDGAARRRPRFVSFPGMATLDAGGWSELDELLGCPEDGVADPAAGERPYRGLASFGRGDAELFFGRDREAESLANRIRRDAVVTVTGASGSGKSSLLHAGVAPRLSELELVALRPGASPRVALRARLARVSSRRAPLLVIVDQAEELFTLCRDPAERRAFAAALARLVADPDGPHRVVFAVRDDFFARLATLPVLGPLCVRQVEVVGAPDREALIDILVRPVERFGYRFEDRALLDAMVAEVEGEPAALALLSFCADRMWEARDRPCRRLTWSAYRDLGGVGGALAAHAEAVIESLTPRQRAIARELLLGLVTAERTRAVVRRAELVEPGRGGSARAGVVLDRLTDGRLVVAHQGTERDEAEVELVHEALIGGWQRLRGWVDDEAHVLRARDRIADAAARWREEGGDRDYLLSEGKPLREAADLLDGGYELGEVEAAFVRASLARVRRRRTLARAAVAAGLVAVVAVATATSLAWRARERATAAAAAREEARSMARMHAEEAALDRAAARAGSSEAALARARAALERDPTEALADLAALDPAGPGWERARLLASDAVSRGAARHVLVAGDDAMTAVAWSPDGRAVATGGRGGAIVVWDLRARTRREIAAHDGAVLALAWSPLGTHLASAGADGRVTLWRAGGDAVRTSERGGWVEAIAFAADGTRLVSGDRSGAVVVWDLAGGGARTVHRHRGRVSDVAIAPGGRRIASAGGDHVVRVSDPGGGSRALAGHARRVIAVAFSPDGERLASGGRDGTVRVWDLKRGDGGAGRVVGRHGGAVTDVAFSPDGRRVAGASADATAALWPLGAGEPRMLRGHGGRVTSVAFAGEIVATASDDGTVRLWPPGRGNPRVLAGHGAAIAAIAVAPDGAALVSTSRDGSARVWDVEAPDVALRDHEGIVGAVDVSADATRVASAGHDGSVRVWRADGEVAVLRRHRGRVHDVALVPGSAAVASVGEDGAVRWWRPGARSRVLGRTGTALRRVAVAPAGDLVAAGGDDGSVVLSPVGDGASRIMPAHRAAVAALAFDPEGRYLASGGWDGETRVVDVARGEIVLRVAHGDVVAAVAWSPDGRRLATASWDGSVRVADFAGGAPLALDGAGAELFAVAFSPDGERLAATGAGGAVRVWHLAGGDALRLRPHTGDVVAVAFGADGDTLYTASRDHTACVIDLASGASRALRGHTAGVGAMTIADGLIVTGGDDGDVRLWRDAAPAEPVPLLGWIVDHTTARRRADGRVASLFNPI